MKRMPKDFVFVVILGIAILTMTAFVWVTHSEALFDVKNVGREVLIEWSEVNVRKGHSTNKEIITSIYHGNTVTLTGYQFDYLGGNSKATESWVEIEMENGTTGWVVRNSINWLG